MLVFLGWHSFKPSARTAPVQPNDLPNTHLADEICLVSETVHAADSSTTRSGCASVVVRRSPVGPTVSASTLRAAKAWGAARREGRGHATLAPAGLLCTTQES